MPHGRHSPFTRKILPPICLTRLFAPTCQELYVTDAVLLIINISRYADGEIVRQGVVSDHGEALLAGVSLHRQSIYRM